MDTQETTSSPPTIQSPPPEQPVIQSSVKPPKSNKLIINALLFITLIGIILFSPIPYYQTEEVTCKIGQTCPKPGWNTNPPLFFSIMSLLTKSNDVQSIKPPESPSTTPSPMPDETADWKTYSNTVFSFKYPAAWDTLMVGEDPGKALMVAPKEKVDKVRQMTGGFGGGIFLTLTISMRSTPPDWKTEESWNVTSEPIVVDGITGTKYTVNVVQSLPGLSEGDRITSVVLKKDATYIQIDLLDKTYETMYDQILSTFKFVDTNTVKTCKTDIDCSANYFCDYSEPGGMGPNGFVSGTPSGSQQCILKCQDNAHCPSGLCQTFEIVFGDISMNQKGCKP
jgi:hypothetical protein